MAKEESWMKNSQPPFGDNSCGRNVVYVNGEIIVSPQFDNHIYKFDMKSNTWSKYKFGNYTNIYYHAVCSSNDKTKLYIYDGMSGNKILLIIDIKTMKVIKEIKNMIWT
eukprot:166272_1